MTIGPVLIPMCSEPGDGEAEPAVGLRQESVVYQCQACDGAGFLTVQAQPS